MRRELAKAVLNEFTQELSKTLPQFRRMKNEPGFLGIYRWQVAPDLFFFLGLQRSPNEDHFTVEVAWSGKDDYPFETFNVSPKERPKGGRFRVRLGGFWSEEDVWWKLVPDWTNEEWDALTFEGKEPEETPVDEALKKVRPEVKDAMERVHQHAVPYLRKIAKKFGYRL
jgi:hypothetical protein